VRIAKLIFCSRHQRLRTDPIPNTPGFSLGVNKKLDLSVRFDEDSRMRGQAILTLAENRALRPPGKLRTARIAQILEAAELEFATSGFEGTSTAAIAARAGLPKANVHYYFGTKDKIYRALLDNILLLWLDEADYWIAQNRTPRAALTGYIKAKLTLARQKPLASRIYANELLRGAPHIAGYLHIALRSRVKNLSAVVTSWVEAGQLQPVAPAHLLFCIWAMTQTYADFAVQIGAVLAKPILDDEVFEEAVATVTKLVLGSLLTEQTT
jgi:TetR/AcrR family transcriptional regulator